MINNVIDYTKLGVTLILSLYALFKPYDSDENQIKYSDMPDLARTLFRCIEANDLMKTYVIESSAIFLNAPLLNKEDKMTPLELMGNSIIIKKELPQNPTVTSSQFKKSVKNSNNLITVLDNNNSPIPNRSRISSKFFLNMLNHT